ncbi:dihydrolipoamide acetyltransferase family protein [Undibacterium terreum]|uniref:Dihydrolipoamide acetyltransferase component of pyruvate dehydrogenase complex n=1 Tax=Undibacterium terreum TaxID=1224302 RepID=A0A916XRL0_9BURK|nr:dihydrolipoamide acetyltransferase family protein [Undibacterium terreum]GGC98279.1 dihydrolipoamide acetyltransferase component of pyruvate dehydrogenase complex [Undibacterium terreum]
MSIHVIKVPDIGEGIAEVELVAWHVQPGDKVAEDQALADVMTDKANVEIPSPVAGTVIAVGGALGQLISVGAELIRIEVQDHSNAVIAENAKNPHAPQEAAAPAVAKIAAVAPVVSVPPMSPPPQPPASKPLAASDSDGADQKVQASPAVRRRARELGIDLQRVSKAAPNGHVTHQDLDAWLVKGQQTRPSTSGADRYTQRSAEEVIPVIGLRRKIAQKMQESKRRIPHFTYVEECDVTEIEALRAELNARWGEQRGRLTLLPLLMRAVVLASQRYPQVNALFDDEAGKLTRYGASHIGIATQTDNGLVVPVVRHAETRDLWSSAAEVARLAQAARAGHATREELSGSTITITSLGALGGIVSTPVINHPEVAIVGVNRMVLRPVVLQGAIVPRKMMNLSSSFDHRVVDGAYAAEFIQAIRSYLEHPATLFVE